MPEPRWLTPGEERAWRGYMLMHPLLNLQIARDLGRDSGLSIADYEVLVSLSETTDYQMRLVDLAQLMLWSKSRLSHHLDRMAARGLVRRERHPSNSRATLITLTDLGRSTIEQAAPHHVESVRRHFIDLLTKEQIDTLGDITETVLAHLTAVQHDSPHPDTDSAP